jgi:hypothetical protein
MEPGLITNVEPPPHSESHTNIWIYLINTIKNKTSIKWISMKGQLIQSGGIPIFLLAYYNFLNWISVYLGSLGACAKWPCWPPSVLACVYTSRSSSLYLLTAVNLLHGAESSLRRRLSLSWLRNSPPFMEPQGVRPQKPTQWNLSRVSWIQYTSSHPTSLRYILILSSHLCLCPTCSLPVHVFQQNFACISHIPHACYLSFLSRPP